MRTHQSANPYKSYRQIATQTAPPGQLVLMLFDGALKSLECALLGFSSTDLAERNMVVHNNLQRATEIVRELNYSLNMDAGGQLAETLRNLYTYFEERINHSNRYKKADPIHEIMPMLKDLRDAWAAMLAQQGTEASAPATLEANRLTPSHY